MKNNLNVLILSALLLGSCEQIPIERNTFVFADRIGAVQDSLIRMASLMQKLPKNTDNTNVNYNFKDGKLMLNGGFSNDEKSIQTDTSKSLSFFTPKERTEFFVLAKYLNGNYLSAGYLDNLTKLWSFDYRYLPDATFEQNRDVKIIGNAKDTAALQPIFRVFTHYEKLYLTGPVDLRKK